MLCRWCFSIAILGGVLAARGEEGLAFTAVHPDFGREPWLYYDGELRFLGDLTPGAWAGDADVLPPTIFSRHGARIVFVGDDARHGTELWEIGPRGPYLPSELLNGLQPIMPGPLVELGEQGVFLARPDDGYFREIWVSDQAGRRCIHDCRIPERDAWIYGPYVDTGRLLFLEIRKLASATRSHPFGDLFEWILFSYDGAAFTQVIAGRSREVPGEHASTVFDGKFYTFLGSKNLGDHALYRMDDAGREMVADSLGASLLLAADDALFGLTRDGAWRYDGTDFERVAFQRNWDTDRFVGTYVRRIRAAVQGQDVLVSFGRQLYRLTEDGMEDAPEYASLICRGRFKTIGGHLYCRGAVDGLDGIYRLDPEEPVLMAALLAKGSETDEDEFDYWVDGERVVYGAGSDVVTHEEGQVRRDTILDPLHVAEPAHSSDPEMGVHYMDWYYFPAETPFEGRELWRTKGGTVERVANLGPGAAGSDPSHLVVFRGILYFKANERLFRHDGVRTEEWRGGGPEALWYRIDDLKLMEDRLIIRNRDDHKSWVWDGVNPPDDVVFRGLINVDSPILDGAAYTAAADYDGEFGYELWELRGGEFSIVADIFPGSTGSYPFYFTKFQDELYFSAVAPGVGRELWKYDGQEATMVADLNPGEAWSDPRDLTPLGDRLYFTALTEEHGYELWVLDNDGPRIVDDLNPGPSGSRIGDLVVFGDEILFSAFTPAHGFELRSYSGDGEILMADIFPGPASSFPEFEFCDGDECYFAANTIEDGRRLFRYDAGLLVPLSDGPQAGRQPEYLASAGDHHYFAATGESGRELYRLRAGEPLELFRDLNRGTASSNPEILGFLGERMIVGAETNQWGRELGFVSHQEPASDAPTCEVLWHDIAKGNEEIYPRYGTGVSTFLETPAGLYFSTSGRLFRYKSDLTEQVSIHPQEGVLRRIEKLMRVGDRLLLIIKVEGGNVQLLEVTGLTAQALPGGEHLSVASDAVFHPDEGRWIFSGWDRRGSYAGPLVLGGDGVSPLAPDFVGTAPRDFTLAGGAMYFQVRLGGGSSASYLVYRVTEFGVEKIDLGHGDDNLPQWAELHAAGANLYVFAPRPGPDLAVITPTGVEVPAGQPEVLAPREVVPLGDTVYLISRAPFSDTDILYHASPLAVTELPAVKPYELTAADDRVFFGARSTLDERELFYHRPGEPAIRQVPSTFFNPWSTRPEDLFWANGKLYLNAAKDVDAPFPVDAPHEFTPPSSFRELNFNDAAWFMSWDEGVLFEAHRSVNFLLADGSILKPDVILSDEMEEWVPFQGGLVATGTTDGREFELYHFDGSAVKKLPEVFAGPGSSSPRSFTAVNIEGLSFVHPFAKWLASEGLPDDGEPEEWAALRDPFGNPLLLKYALGIPAGEGGRLMRVAHPEERSITITLAVPEAVTPGVKLVVETTKTLDHCDWEPLATRGPSGLWRQELGLFVFGFQGDRRSVTITLPAERDSGRYFRLRAELSPR